MKTIVTLDKADQPYGFPQLDGSGNLQATGSLYGSASYAELANTASYASSSGLNTTQGYIPYNSSSAFTDSNIYYDGTNTGIGTSTPAYTLDVNGNFNLSGNQYYPYIALNGLTSAYGLNYLQVAAREPNAGIAANYLANGNPTGYGYAFQFQANQYANGLLLVGDNTTQAHYIHTDAGAAGNGWPLIFGVAPTHQNWNTSTKLLVLTADQKVGIGTIAPTYSLDVSGSGRYTNGLTITGSLIAPTITGSLQGTASWAVTASYALSSSIAQTASDIVIQVINQSGAQINKGIVVRVTGSNNASDTPRIGVADYTNDNYSANTIGLVLADIPNGGTGSVMTEGLFKGYDTSTPGWTSGQLVFLGANGAITGSAPVAPLHGVRLGQVTRVQNPNGAIYIRIDNGYELDELHDVLITSPTTGNLLTRSGSVWINSNNLTGSYGISGSLTIQGNLLPGSPYVANTSSYSLGSPTAAWKDIYVSNGSLIFITGSVSSSLKLGINGTIYLTGSLQGTSSYATTASYALVSAQSPFPYTGDASISGSLFVTGSTTTQSPMHILSGSTSLLYVSSSGRVGINTAVPTTDLDVNGAGRFVGSITAQQGIIVSATNYAIGIVSQFKAGNASNTVFTNRLTNAGTPISPSFVAYTSNVAGIPTYTVNKDYGYAATVANDGALQVTRAAIQVSGSNNTAGSEAGDLIFLTQTGGTAMSEKMRIKGNGNVLINTTTDSGYKFYVNGQGGFGSGLDITGVFNGATIASAVTQMMIGTTNNTAQTYKTTNAGSNITPHLYIYNSAAAGNMSLLGDRSNGFVLAAGNGTNTIARAGINITNLTNTAGSEAGDMIFLTQTGGAAMAERVRITGTGNVTVASGSLTLTSGSIVMPNRPAFRVSGSNSTNITVVTTITATQGASVDYNQGNYYNNTTGIFTAPIAGLYSVYFNGRVGSVNSQMQVIVYKNAGVALMWEAPGLNASTHFGVSGIVYLAVNDTLKATVTAGSIQFDGNDSWGAAYIG